MYGFIGAFVPRKFVVSFNTINISFNITSNELKLSPVTTFHNVCSQVVSSMIPSLLMRLIINNDVKSILNLIFDNLFSILFFW